jgi:hypothetical protein
MLAGMVRTTPDSREMKGWDGVCVCVCVREREREAGIEDGAMGRGRRRKIGGQRKRHRANVNTCMRAAPPLIVELLLS